MGGLLNNLGKKVFLGFRSKVGKFRKKFILGKCNGDPLLEI
jgi:hypothetical protein